MPNTASELAQRLAREAEAVCRHYGVVSNQLIDRSSITR